MIIDARELTPRQLKENRARANQSLIVTAGDSGRESHVVSYVARSTIVDVAELGDAATHPWTREADDAVAAALDAIANPGAAQLAGALAADRVRHCDRVEQAPPVIPAFDGASTVERARVAALGTLHRMFRSMQEPKYTPAQRKSMSDLLRTVGEQARRVDAIVEICRSRTPPLIALVLSFALLGQNSRIYRTLS